MEKAMATHSSTLAWKIAWTEEPGRLQSMGSLGVRHGWATSLSLFTFMHWRRKWQPTPVLLPRESHGQRSLVGYSPRGRKESDTTERFHFHFLSFPQSSCIVHSVKNLTAVQETWVQSLGQEDLLKKEMATHPVFLPGGSHGQRSLAGYSPWGCKSRTRLND